MLLLIKYTLLYGMAVTRCLTSFNPLRQHIQAD